MKKWSAHAVIGMLILTVTLGALGTGQAVPNDAVPAGNEPDAASQVIDCADIMGPHAPGHQCAGPGLSDQQGLIAFAQALCTIPDFQQGCQESGLLSSTEDDGEEPQQPAWDAARDALTGAMDTARGAMAGTDAIWDTVQKDAFDVAFQEIYLALKTALEGGGGGRFLVDENTQNGDTEPLDRDEDGSTDAYRIKYRANANNAFKDEDTVWLQADYIWDFSEQQAMIVDPQTGVTRVTGFNITAQGNDLYLTIINNTNAPDPWGHIIVNGTASTADDDFEFLVLNVVHEYDRFIRVPDGTWDAPIDLFKIVPLNLNDLDGDGNVAFQETYVPDYNFTASNPFNTFSVPGDADADGCFWPTDTDDRNPDVNPCDVFPFVFDVLDLDIDPLDEGARIWGTAVPVSLDIEFDPESLVPYPGAAGKVTSWRVVYTEPTGNHNEIGTICDDSSGQDWAAPGLTCVWDTTEADDTVDTVHANYLAKAEVCIAGTEEQVCELTEGIAFEVANKADFKYLDLIDLVPGDADDDRDDWMSDVVDFNFTASHPEYDIVSFNITAQTCTGSSGVSCDNTNTITYLVDVGDPRLTLNETSGNWTFRHDTSPYPVSDSSTYNGVKYIVKTYTNAPHDKDERVGERTGDHFQGWPFCVGSTCNVKGKPVFNNRAPEITSFAVEIETPSSEQSDQQTANLGFHYRDPDNTAAEKVTVWVEGPDFVERVDDCQPQGVTNNMVPSVDQGIVGTAAFNFDISDVDYACSWNSQGRLGNFSWHVEAFDGDRHHNVTNQTSPPTVNIITENIIPTLSQPSVEAKSTNPPGAATGTFAVKVRYTDTIDAPAYVGVTLVRIDGGNDEPIVKEMFRCPTQSSAPDNLDTLESLAGLPLVSKRDAEYCTDVALSRGTTWQYMFNATDLRGGEAILADPVNFTKEVVESVCGHCMDKGQSFSESQTIFQQTITDLNTLPLALTPHGGDFWSQPFGAGADSDGDFVPDLLEAWLLHTNVLDVDVDNDVATADPAQLHDEWVIRVNHHGGLIYGGEKLLEIRISDDGDHLSLDVCPWQEEQQVVNQHTVIGPCLIESRELSEIDFAITDAGLWFEAIGPTQARELLFILDLTKLGSETDPIVYIEFGAAVKSPTNGAVTEGGSSLAIMSNPFEIVQGGTGLGALPAGIKVDATTGNYVLYAGDVEQEVDTTGVDGDGDGYPDASEVLICVTPGAALLLGGTCSDDLTDFRPGGA